MWFEDEARFGQQGTISRKWAPTGSRPPGVRQTQYDYLYVLGALCPATGQSVGLLSPSLNTPVVNLFFEQFAREVDDDVHVVLIWDRAGYHTAAGVQLPANVTVIELPPKSPELNPVENLWHYLRDHHWSNQAYPDYDDLFDAATDAWQASCLDPDLIKSVCHVSYLDSREVQG